MAANKQAQVIRLKPVFVKDWQDKIISQKIKDLKKSKSKQYFVDKTLYDITTNNNINRIKHHNNNNILQI